MFKYKNSIFLYIFLTILISISSLTWPLIKIPFNEKEIIGEYYLNNYHSLNDPLRYLYFIMLPIIGYFFFKIYFEKKKIRLSLFKFELDNSYFESKKLIYALLLVLSFFLLEFFSILLPSQFLDIFHEGQKLSAAYKNSVDGSYWSGSFYTTGIILESLGTKLIWEIFNHQSIGLMRYLELIYILIFKFSIIFLLFEIVKKTLSDEKRRVIFFLVLSFVSCFLIDYNIGTGDTFSFRDLPIILSLIIFFRYLGNFKNIFYLFVVLGFLSVSSFFWSIDRAIIVNLLIIFFVFIILINRDYINFFLLFFSIIFFWFISYFFLGKEFGVFVENSLSIFKEVNYIFGIIHPTPFSDVPNGTRSTKSLILILVSILISLSFLFNNYKEYKKNFKLILLTLSCVCFLSYIYALGRTDGGHIKQTTGILYLFYSVFIFYHLIIFTERKINLKIGKYIYFGLTFVLGIIFFSFGLDIKTKKISNFSERFKEYIYLDDSNFLTENQNNFVNQAMVNLNKYECIQLFTYDAALLYLLKKPNCSKYYFIYSIGSFNAQKKMINEMKDTNLIIRGGDTNNWKFSPERRLPLVDRYIKKNFVNKRKILNWEIKYR